MPRHAPNGWIRTVESFPVDIPSGTSAAEFLTDLVPGFERELEAAAFTTKVAATGAGATRTLRVVKNASTVVATGTITLAGMSDLGEQTALTVTDDGVTNKFEDADTLTIDSPASGAVSFTAGEGILTLVWRQRPQIKN